MIYIPIGQLANAQVKNFTVPDLSMRVNVEFGVVYGSDTDRVREVVLSAVKNTEGVLEDPEPLDFVPWRGRLGLFEVEYPGL